MRINTRTTQRTLNYLAMIHLSGYYPSGLHTGSRHSTDILLGYTYDTTTCRFVVKGDILPLLENHPMVLTLKALAADGYKVHRSRLMSYKRWTISKGVPLMNTLDLRTGVIYVDGNFRQWENAEGRWASSPEKMNPGKDAKERAQREAAAHVSVVQTGNPGTSRVPTPGEDL